MAKESLYGGPREGLRDRIAEIKNTIKESLTSGGFNDKMAALTIGPLILVPLYVAHLISNRGPRK